MLGVEIVIALGVAILLGQMTATRVRLAPPIVLLLLGMLLSAGAAVRWIKVERSMRHKTPLPLPLIAPFVAIQLAYRLRPVYARLTSQLDHYQEVVEPLRRLAMWGIPVFFGFFAGFAASAQWETVWLWANRVDTGVSDPQFQMDTGFYLFSLPFFTTVLGFASAVLLVCLIVTALVAYLYGSVRVGQRELRISKAARIREKRDNA